MDFFRRRKILKRLNFLEATPFRTCEHVEGEGGKVSVQVPKFRNDKVSRFMLGNRPRYFLVHLDEMGSFVWLQIDGKRQVGEICDIISEKHDLNPDEAVERVTKFLTQLYEQRYLSFIEITDSEIK